MVLFYELNFYHVFQQNGLSLPLSESSQMRRVVVSHNVDKVLKEGQWKQPVILTF